MPDTAGRWNRLASKDYRRGCDRAPTRTRARPDLGTGRVTASPGSDNSTPTATGFPGRRPPHGRASGLVAYRPFGHPDEQLGRRDPGVARLLITPRDGTRNQFHGFPRLSRLFLSEFSDQQRCFFSSFPRGWMMTARTPLIQVPTGPDRRHARRDRPRLRRRHGRPPGPRVILLGPEKSDRWNVPFIGNIEAANSVLRRPIPACSPGNGRRTRSVEDARRRR